jgi:hypothetical protein
MNFSCIFLLLLLLWIPIMVVLLGRYESEKIKAFGQFFKDIFGSWLM